MKKVLISGANGFIGQNLARRLKKDGYEVVGVDVENRPGQHLDSFFRRRLLEPLGDIFNGGGFKSFIHCAYYLGEDEFKINVEGTKMWAEEAKRNGVPLQIFLSSISAREDASAAYGRLKFETEKWFLNEEQVVLRLGMVIGDGGFFGRIVQTVKKWPVLPLIDGGRYLVYFIGIENVCEVIRLVIENKNVLPRGVVWNAFQPKPTTLRWVMQTIKEEYGLTRYFLPIPYGLVLGTVLVLERFPFLKLGINSNNVRGLKQYEGLNIGSDLPKFGFENIDLRELVAKSKKAASSTENCI